MVSVVAVTLGILSLAVICTSVLTAIGVRYRTEPGARWFTVTMGFVSLWIVVSLVSLVVNDLAVLRVVHVVGIALTQLTPVCWFCFVLDYTGREGWVTRRSLGLLFFVPTLTITAVSTNPLHSLYYRGYRLAAIDQDTLMFVTEAGPAAYLGLCYAGLLFVVGLWLVVQMLTDHDRLFSGQAVWLLVGSVAPISVAFLSASDTVPEAIPLLSASFAITGLAYGYGLFRHRLLDFAPATRRIGTRAVFDDLRDGLVIVDTDGDVAAINESARRQFDCVDEAVLGDPLTALDSELAGIREASSVDIERGGELFEITVSPVEDSRRRSAGYALVVRDVTVSRARKQHLEVLNRVLRHNLRNDMTVIKGYAEILDDDDDSGMAASILDTATELHDLAEKAREVERTVGTDAVAREETAIPALLDSLASKYGQAYPGHVISVEAPADLVVVTDPTMLELVVDNLLENALEHHPATADVADQSPGAVTDDTASVAVSASQDADGVTIQVTDDGPGIPDNELRVLRNGEESALEHSSGLGLWLAQWCTARLGGRLSFETNDGTTVRIWLPTGTDRTGPSNRAPEK